MFKYKLQLCDVKFSDREKGRKKLGLTVFISAHSITPTSLSRLISTCYCATHGERFYVFSTKHHIHTDLLIYIF